MPLFNFDPKRLKPDTKIPGIGIKSVGTVNKPVVSNTSATNTSIPNVNNTPKNSSISTPAAQNYINSQNISTTSTAPLNTPNTIPLISTSTTSDNKSAYLKYLTGMFDEKTVNNARKAYEDQQKRLADIQSSNEAADVAARKGYQANLDRPGGLVSGAEQSAQIFQRRSGQDSADRALKESAAARSALVAQNTYNQYIDAGKSVYEAEQATQKAQKEGGFSLSEGQTRYEINPATGKYEVVGTGVTSTKEDEILTPTEASTLGVPYGTTRSQAYGQTPQKPATEAQNKASMFAVRTDDANKILNELEGRVSTMNPISFGTQSSLEDTTIGNTLVSDDIKQVRQAERNFLNSILRRESGAVISPTEFANGAKQYFPRPGDDKKTLEQKARNRTVAITALKNEAGNAYTNVSGDLSQAGGGLFAEEW